MSPLDQAVLYQHSGLIRLLLAGGSGIDKPAGEVYYPGHYSNSLLFSLWKSADLGSVQVLREAGHIIRGDLLHKLFRVASQLLWDTALLQQVNDMLSQPLSLKAACRVAVRRRLMDMKLVKHKPLTSLVDQLPLPPSLKSYISMLDEHLSFANM